MAFKAQHPASLATSVKWADVTRRLVGLLRGLREGARALDLPVAVNARSSYSLTSLVCRLGVVGPAGGRGSRELSGGM